MKSQHILIVGGGIAGLTLAIALTQQGHHVEVVERTPEWKPVGAGIMLQANAIAILTALGIKQEIEQLGLNMPSMQVMDRNGRFLSKLSFKDLDGELGSSYALHRADLHQCLLNACTNVSIQLNESVQNLQQTETQVQVQFTSGQSAQYDLVIGADGYHSKVRSLIYGKAAPQIVYSGYSCWRFVGKNRDKLTSPVEMWGRGARVGVVPLTNGRCYIYMTKNAPAGQADPTENRQAQVAAQFADFQGPARSALSQLDGDKNLMRHDLMELEKPAWGNGRILLVGDAAHALTPNMGQGAAQAIEGALALTIAIDEAQSIPMILQRYKQLHQKRVEQVQIRSRQVGQIAQWSNDLACHLRDFIARVTPQSASQKNLQNTLSPGIRLAHQFHQGKVRRDASFYSA